MSDFFAWLWGTTIEQTVCRVLGHREVREEHTIVPPDGGDFAGRTEPFKVVATYCGRCGSSYINFNNSPS